jgi:hypothetical protein
VSGWSDNPGVCGESPEEREARLAAKREKREKEEAFELPQSDPVFFERLALRFWFVRARIRWFFQKLTLRRNQES